MDAALVWATRLVMTIGMATLVFVTIDMFKDRALLQGSLCAALTVVCAFVSVLWWLG